MTVSKGQSRHEPATYEDAIDVARRLIDDSTDTNPEYTRGIVELIAELFSATGTFLATRKAEVEWDLAHPNEANNP